MKCSIIILAGGGIVLDGEKCTIPSMDSDLEAFSHNPTDGS